VLEHLSKIAAIDPPAANPKAMRPAGVAMHRGSCFSGSVIRLFEIVLVARSSRMFISIGINTSMCKARIGGVVHHNYSTI
jgi:hypothetical protein